MPQFPSNSRGFDRYQSGAQLTTEAPSVLHEPDMSDANKAAAIGQVAGAAEQAVFKWQNAMDTIQKTSATANFKTGMLDIQQRAESDPNYNNSQQYFDEINKLKDENLKGFHSKIAQSEMTANFDYESKVGQIQVDNIYKKKLIDVGQTSTLKLIDSEVNNPTEHSLPAIKQILDTQIKGGLISHEDAYKLESKANKELGTNRVNRDLNNAQTPQALNAVMTAIHSGAYEQGGVQIPEEVKQNAMNQAAKRSDYLHKQAIGDTEDALMRADAMKTLTADQVEQAALTNTISKSFYDALKKKFLSTIGPSASTDKVAYSNIVSMLLNPNVKPDTARTALLNSQAEGKISVDDFQKLYQLHLTPGADGTKSLGEQLGQAQVKNDFQKVVADHELQKASLLKKQSFLSSALGILQNAAGHNFAQSASMTQDFTNQALNKNASPEDFHGIAKQILNKEILKAHPEISNFPKEGRIKIDAHGNKVRVFPDGTFQEIGHK